MRKICAILVSISIIVGLFACGMPTSTTTDADNTDSHTKTTDTPTQQETASESGTTISDDPVELTFWDLRTEGLAAEMVDQLIADFESKNPNITVKRTAFKVSDLRNTIKPAINSGEGPDIFSYDAGAGYLGVLANSGLALDLTPYAQQYGWNSRYHDWALEQTTYNDMLYGIANELEIIGVFYNKKMFEDNGLTPPETYDEFLTVCKTLKDAGINPVILDDKDKWPGFHYESIWLNSFAGVEQVQQAVDNEISWDTPGFGEALDQLHTLVESGYTTEMPLGLGNEDANNLFYSGEGAMKITGTWIVNGAVEKMGDDVGFFYLPPSSGDIPDCPPGGLGEAVVINGKTKHPNETAMFLDFMFTPENVGKWYEAGMIPAVQDVDVSQYELSPLFKEIVKEINEAEALGINIDVLMPPLVNDVTQNYMQEVIAGKKTGDECMALKQAEFEKEIEAGNYSVS